MNGMFKRRRALLLKKPLLEFYVTQNGSYYEFFFEEGMTWNDFVNGKYNDGSFSISGTEVVFKGGKISGENPSEIITPEKNYESLLKLVVFANGNRSLSAGSAVSGTSYSKNYSFTGGAIRIAAGESGRLTIQGIDFSNYSSLKIKAKLFINGDADSLYHYVGYGDTKATSDTQSNKVTKGVPKTETTLTFNIQNATGSKYIYLVCAQSGGVYIDVYDIWLE